MNRSHAVLSTLAATWLSVAGILPAQTFTEDISILEVEVPVQVLVDGRPVRGLKRDNFELLVDGEPQELSWFEAIEIGESLTGAPAAAPESAGARPDAPAAAWRRHHLLLFDLGSTSRSRLRDTVREMRRMLEGQSDPSDRLAIALFAEAIGARILVPFTSDRQGLELGFRFLESLADARSRKSLEALEELDRWWRASDHSGALPKPLLADMGAAAETLIQPHARPVESAGVGLPLGDEGSDRARKRRLDSLFAQRSGGLSAVRALGRSMANLITLLRDIPEPKQVLYLSRGLGSLFNEPETATPVLHRLAPMVDAFGDSGWTLHAIDIGGIPAPPTSALAGPEDYDSRIELGLGTVVTAGSDNSSLFYLANETGGELFENYNRIHKATAKLLERTRASYLLAFQPADLAADGERYRIEVRLKPGIPGARVVHRPGFRAPRPPIERLLAERRMDAAELALSGRTLAELRMRVLPIVLPSAEGGRVPIFVELETNDLEAGKKRRKRVRLDIHGYVLDDAGRVRAGFARDLRFGLGDERVVGLVEEVELGTGAHELRLLAWDLRGGRRHLLHLPLRIRALEPGRPFLAGPFFVASAEHRRQYATRAPGGRDALELFELATGPAAVDPEPAIERGRSRRFLIFGRGWSGAEAGTLAVRLLDADGAVVREGFELERLADGARGTARFTGLLSTAELVAGRYRLEAALAGSGAPVTVAAATELIVIEPGPQSR